jgi:pyrroloquinoline quinone (PQQ) biosynthesis protein C
VKFARYLGVKDEELFSARPIPELEIRLNTTIAYRSQSPAQTAVRWMLEGFVGYHLKHSREILHGKYGIPDEMLQYFDIHIAADLEEHGPEGAMMLAKLYKEGLVSEEDQDAMRVQVERNVEGAHPGSQTYTWADILYERFCAGRLL